MLACCDVFILLRGNFNVKHYRAVIFKRVKKGLASKVHIDQFSKPGTAVKGLRIVHFQILGYSKVNYQTVAQNITAW